MDALNLENDLNLFNIMLSMIEFVIIIYFFVCLFQFHIWWKPPTKLYIRKNTQLEVEKKEEQ